MENKKEKTLQIKASDQELKGHYSDVMYVSHSKEEFILDFLLMKPPVPQLVSRIVISPGHLKRIITTLQKSIEKYEQNFSEIEEAEEPNKKGDIGFIPRD